MRNVNTVCCLWQMQIWNETLTANISILVTKIKLRKSVYTVDQIVIFTGCCIRNQSLQAACCLSALQNMFLKVLANWHENGRIWTIWILAQTSNSGCIHLPLLLQFYSGQEGLPQNSTPLRFNWHNTDLNTKWRRETVLLTLLPKWHRSHSDMTGDGHLTCRFSYVCECKWVIWVHNKTSRWSKRAFDRAEAKQTYNWLLCIPACK